MFDFNKYIKTPDKPTKSVYGWVPVEVVNAIINAHGGLQTHKDDY